MLSRSDKMVLVARRVAHALKMSLLVTGVAFGSAALWYLVNAPDGRETTALLNDLKSGPVYVSKMGVEGWQQICLVWKRGQ